MPHCPTKPLATGQLDVPNVSDSNISIAYPSSGPYRGVILTFSGLPLAQNNGTVTAPLALPSGSRLDSTGVSYSTGNATITDPNCVSGDVGSSVSPGNIAPPFNIPSTAIIQTVNPGVSFTVQNNSQGLPTGNGSSVIINANQHTIFGEGGGYAFAQMLNNDGWIVVSDLYPEQYYSTSGSLGVYNDILNDSTFGARYKSTTLLWFDHLAEYCALKFGPTMPLVAYGGSWGGYHTLLWAANQAPSRKLIGYIGIVPATLISNASTGWIGPANYGPATINGYPGLPNGTSGADLGPNDLVNITIPGFIQTNTNDQALGYSQTTVASGSNNANVTGITTLYVADNTQITIGPLIRVNTSNGYAWFNVTSSSTSGQLSVTYMSGTGTVITGNAVVQNLIAQMLINASSNTNITSVKNVGENHFFNISDANIAMNWVTATLDQVAPKIH
jgi:hypothetical protein